MNQPEKIRVIQIIDTLSAGGAERMAVNVANELPQDQFESHLCVTRVGGSLEKLIAPHVKTIYLDRRSTFDLRAFRKLFAYLRNHHIQIIHTHSSSLYIGSFVALPLPSIRLFWHVHKGKIAESERLRDIWMHRLVTLRVGFIITASRTLEKWMREHHIKPADRIEHLHNFVVPPKQESLPPIQLPGEEGYRIVCVANLRPEKDHFTLLQAMKLIVEKEPKAHLLLVGGGSSPAYRKQVESLIAGSHLSQHVSLLGMRNDVPAILRVCTIGVMSSTYEAMPVTLIEYGFASLASVATNVGDCHFVLDGGRAGKLVPARSSQALADAILEFLQAPDVRKQYGTALHNHVQAQFSADAIIGQIATLYTQFLKKS